MPVFRDDSDVPYPPQTDPGRLALGRVVDDRYLIIAKLGQGGMGTVWKARDSRIARDVAIKEPHLPRLLSEADRAVVALRLEREARAAAQIDHPAVVTIHDVLTGHEQPLIVMEFIDGQSLADLLAEGTLTPDRAARIALPIVGALVAAHACDVLHRDVKPSNIMIGRGGRVVLTDFGVASVQGEASTTYTGAVAGSDDYTAPERIRGVAPGPESDLFSLGAVLYTATEGFSPFARLSRQATFEAVQFSEPPPPRRAGDLTDLVLGLLRKDPAARPGIAEITAILEHVAATPPGPNSEREEPVEPSAPDLAEPARPKWVLLALTALCAAVIAGLVVALVMWFGGIARHPMDEPRATAAEKPVVPPGWTAVHKIGATIAVPSGYQAVDLYDHGGGVAFQTTRGQVDRELLLLRWDIPGGTPEERAHYWYWQNLQNTAIADQQVTLSRMRVNGRTGIVLTMTFRGDGGQLWRKRELYYDSGHQPWKIVVDWAVDGAQNTDGDDLFEGAVRSFSTG
ncbi:serine/threonine-protein kinase [Nocardia macrotermitis]|uniref:non-specific serine/threonine protein kinase n=1 Tax=Nocardia macrotermitis TaxID=2585198 RepID=A0A7K0DDL4_9NOCA|nr:serine/threonine-protein kinase [Nocardia macrotermitis]MQY23896.1 Serine/threonine-protein kinase PknD [Nocardia macrotermitis]